MSTNTRTITITRRKRRRYGENVKDLSKSKVKQKQTVRSSFAVECDKIDTNTPKVTKNKKTVNLRNSKKKNVFFQFLHAECRRGDKFHTLSIWPVLLFILLIVSIKLK